MEQMSFKEQKYKDFLSTVDLHSTDREQLLNSAFEAGCDAVLQAFCQPPVSCRFSPPFRVGRKQRRAVLDSKGLEVVIFPTGLECMAELYCLALNRINGS